MRFASPLIPAILLKRYKRFLADAVLEDGREVTAHIANTGKMLGLAQTGARIWLRPSPDPKAKLPFQWWLEEAPAAMVGVNTHAANLLMAEALAERRLADMGDYESVAREPAYESGHRADFRLAGPGGNCLVEVKSVTLVRDGWGEFPDTVSVRGTRHLDALARACSWSGQRAVVAFVAQRPDVTRIRLAADLDPAFAAAAVAAQRAGVAFLGYRCSVSPEGMALDCAVPVTILPCEN